MTYEIRLIQKLNREGDVIDSWFELINPETGGTVMVSTTWSKIEEMLED